MLLFAPQKYKSINTRGHTTDRVLYRLELTTRYNQETSRRSTQNAAFFDLVDLLMRDLWMCGITPPPAIVALMRVSSSSSPRIASCRWRGVIRFTLRSLQAFPANSSTSAVRYSRMADVYTAAVAPTRWLCWTELFKKRWTLPTGNCCVWDDVVEISNFTVAVIIRSHDMSYECRLTCKPAFDERDWGAFLIVGALPPFPPLPPLPPFPDCKQQSTYTTQHKVRLSGWAQVFNFWFPCTTVLDHSTSEATADELHGDLVGKFTLC